MILPVFKRSTMACGRVLSGLLLGLLWSGTGTFSQASENFPRPPEIEPAVQFWTKVYTEVDTGSGFLHDSRNLSVIYARLPLDRRRIEDRRNRISRDLRVLAGGKREGLTPSQAELLALWPPGVSNQTLQRAAANVRWQLGQSDRFVAGLQRSGAYRDHISEVIRDKNLPPELVVLPHVESSFNPGAYSSAAAAGMWQFGRATGRRFMRIDHIVDERMDPYLATHAAMSLLEYNYSVLGTWPLALTAYNHGAGGILRAVRQTGTTDIETIVAEYRGRAFGFASRNFYAQFLAVLDVEGNARQYFGEVALAVAPDFRIVTADAYLDAAGFARSLGIPLATLRADNPALRPAIWQGNKRIPRDFPVRVRADALPGSGQDLLAMIPADYKFSRQTPDVAYVVERGDSLSVIARRFDTTVSDLVALNQLPSRHRIQIGQRLLLPRDTSESAEPQQPKELPEKPPVRSEEKQPVDLPVVQRQEDAEAIDPAQQITVSPEQLAEALAADPSEYGVASNNSIEIQASETLGHYAEWLGIRAWDIRRLNGMAYRDPVIIGERLLLDFSQVNIAGFERARREFHLELQREFFASYRIQDVESYRLRQGDHIGRIARERYATPIWLLRQYNPELDLNRTQVGQEIVFPLLERVN